MIAHHHLRVLTIEVCASHSRQLRHRLTMLCVEFGWKRDSFALRQIHQFLVRFRMIVDHALTKCLHRFTRTLLRSYATQFDFHHAAHCRVHKKVVVLRGHVCHAGMCAHGVTVSRVAIAFVRVLRLGSTAGVAVTVLVRILVQISDAGFAGHDPEPAHEQYGQRPDVCRSN